MGNNSNRVLSLQIKVASLLGHQERVWQERNCKEIDWHKEGKGIAHVESLMDQDKCVYFLIVCENHILQTYSFIFYFTVSSTQ